MTGGLIVIFGIIAMVMIHEGGHFVAAKAVGMKATEFFSASARRSGRLDAARPNTASRPSPSAVTSESSA